MAIYHVSAQVISRGGGRCSVAAAAYRSAERMVDERLGVVHDYTAKAGDVLHKEILKPDNAPEWVENREKLWNEVEKAEKRKDAQLAREFVISLPKELSLEQNVELGRSFVQKEFVERGMVADMCLHDGSMYSGESQPHMHVMLTLREITESGFGNKVRQWNDKGLLIHWRESWANLANESLVRAGFDIRIDHRTLEAQGIDLEPQNKIGPKSERDRYTENVKEHEEIARVNGDRIFEEPEIALKALTSQYSTFTHHDIARLVNRQTVDKEQFAKVYERVKASTELVYLGLDENNRERYTTHEMLSIEKELVMMAKELSDQKTHYVSHSIQERVLKGYDFSKEQDVAFKYVTDANDFSCVIGFAGTGKSYMLRAAREAWEKEGYRVMGMALSGIAAENLEESSGIRSYTVASRILSWENGSNKLSGKDIVVVDEAGMLGSIDAYKIMKEVKEAGAKPVFVGDFEQMQAMLAGAPFRAIAERCGYTQMNDIRRQEIGWQREATFCFATGQTGKALDMYQRFDDVQMFDTRQKAMVAMVANWKQDLMWNQDKTQIMMAYTRVDVEKLNLEARNVMSERGILGESHNIKTDKGMKLFAENDRVYFLRNDKELGVKNGTLGTIREIKDDRLTVETEKGRVSFSTHAYNHLDYGYATTVYKAQGVTVDKAHVLASPNYNRHATYVAMSRHKEEVKLYWAKEDFSSFYSLKNRMGRSQYKDISLDYIDTARSFAATRNIDLDLSDMPKLVKDEMNDIKNNLQNHELSNGIERHITIEQSFKQKHAVERLYEYDYTLINKPHLNSIENRLEARYNERIRYQDIASLRDKFSKDVSFELQVGIRGNYHGITQIGNEKYGIIEQTHELKLVKAKFCGDLDKGSEVQIKSIGSPEKQGLMSNQKSQDNQKITIEQVKERSRTRDFEVEM